MFFIYLVALIATTVQAADECYTPNDELAKCISLKSCPVLQNALNDPNAYGFLQLSACGDRIDDGLVCCGSTYNFVEMGNTFEDEDVCGFQHSDDYIHTGDDEPALSAFPWVALLGYRKVQEHSTKYLCNGVLINKRYVLTSAHCWKREGQKPKTVRLGEYHLGNRTDCLPDSTVGKHECSDDIEEIEIEKFLVHPQYTKKRRENNIALIRLNRIVDYSDYIRPICLPSSDRPAAKVGDTVTISGWDDKAGTTGTKKVRLNTVISESECQSSYPKKPAEFFEGVICGIPKNDHDLCYSDAGSPVMFSHKQRWHLEGITSLTTSCGTHLPDIYTKVEKYIDWIKENIEP